MLADQIKRAEKAGAKWLHIDVMDGHFVPNISFAMPVIKSIRKYTDMFFDVHLMITPPEKYIDDFINAGADGVTFHIEATEKTDKCIELIRNRGKRVGISINPNTPVSAIEKYLDKVDMVLVMSVEPGYGGQKFISECLSKITAVRKRMPRLDVMVDGGVNAETAVLAARAGANQFVAGSYLFKQLDMGASVDALRASCSAAVPA